MGDARGPRAVAVLAVLIGLTLLLVGCGGGGGSDTASPTLAPTPAPTAPPTPAPTPAPTQPPTESWAKAVCSWREKDGSDIINEVGCDDKNQQIRIYSIGINYERLPLGPDQTCSQACDSFLQSRCVNGTRNQTATMCACQTEKKNEDGELLILEDSQSCDAGAKEAQLSATHKTTHPFTKPYNKDQQCPDTMNAWLENFEKTHPRSCSHHSIGVIVRSDLLV